MALARLRAASEQRFNIIPTGAINGTNRVFTAPEAFLYDTLRVYRNGQRQKVEDDYIISESGGPGTGFDTVTFAVLCTPKTGAVLLLDYFVS